MLSISNNLPRILLASRLKLRLAIEFAGRDQYPSDLEAETWGGGGTQNSSCLLLEVNILLL